MPVVTDHIRGPWRAEGWENLVVNDANGNTVVCCPGGSRGATLDQLQARAALIAAAPETARHRDTLIDALHDLLTRPTDAAARLRSRAAIEAASVPADPAAEALRRAESFIAGFEDDETQEGIADLLATIRAAIAGAPADPVRDAAGDMLALLKGALEAWPEIDTDEEINGGDMVEWFGDFAERAAGIIAKAEGRANG